RLAPHRPDRRQRMDTLLRMEQIAAAEHRQPALRPVLFRERSELPELLERQSMTVAPRGADLEAQELEPVAQTPFADHALLTGRIAVRRQQVPKPPRSGRREAQDDDLSVGTQHAIDLAQQRVRRTNALERMRQNDGIDAVRRDRERGRIADDVRTRVGTPVDEDLALGSRVPQERLRPAPAADLQEVLAEHALEHSARQPLLVRKTTAAERRREPVAERLEPAVIAVGHASILAAPPGGRARALPSVRARVRPLSPNRDSQCPATERASGFWDM